METLKTKAPPGRRFSPFICIVYFLLSFRTVESGKKNTENILYLGVDN